MKGLVVVPACNEAVSLEHFLPRLQGEITRSCLSNGLVVDIVVVDDGSNDHTSKVVQQRNCRLIRNVTNQGVGYSVRRGYQMAIENNYDFVVTMDSDGQHDVRLLPTVIKHIQGGADVVTASRYHPDSPRFSPPLDRDLLNIAVTSMMHAVTGWKHITDPLTGFWGVRKEVVNFLADCVKNERYGIWVESYIKLWYLMSPQPKMVEVPHPAIYSNAAGGFLNRLYSPANLEDRLDRFGTHALHIIRALQDVVAAGQDEAKIYEHIGGWRQHINERVINGMK